MLDFSKLKFTVEQLIDLSRKFITRFLLKSYINHFNILAKCSQHVFFFIEIFVRLPIFDEADKNYINPAGSKNFINTTLRKKFINKLISAINSNSSLLVQKSMGLGATTSMIVTVLWYVLFIPKSRIVIISPVFSGKKFSSTASSIFYTMISIYNKLLQELIISSLYFDSHRNGTKFYTVENPRNGSSLVLLASSKPVDLTSFFPDEQALDYKAIIFDEFAFQKQADAMWKSVENEDICKIVISSANGKSNLFYKLVSEKTLPTYTMHWINAPSCDDKWYQQICENNDPVWVEQYINIDYNFKYSIKKAAKSCNEKKTATRKVPCSKVNRTQRLYKAHRNPKNVTTPCDFSDAMAKYVTTTHQNGVSNHCIPNQHSPQADPEPELKQETIKAMLDYKEKTSTIEPQIFDSLEIIINLIYGINDKHLNIIEKQPFKLLKLVKKPFSPQRLVTLINEFTYRLTA